MVDSISGTSPALPPKPGPLAADVQGPAAPSDAGVPAGAGGTPDAFSSGDLKWELSDDQLSKLKGDLELVDPPTPPAGPDARLETHKAAPEVKTREVTDPDERAKMLDLPGFDVLGATPQSLVNMLDQQPDKIKIEVSTLTEGDKTRETRRFYTVDERGRPDKELIQHGEEGKGQAFELQKHRYEDASPDGKIAAKTYTDSQVFYQGCPEDTVVTKTREEDGWKVSTSLSQLKELKPKEGEAPALVTTRQKDDATAAELDGLVKEDRQLAKLQGTPAFQQFMQAAAKGPKGPDGKPRFEVVKTSAWNENGDPQRTQIVVKAGDAMLALATDGEHAGVTFANGEHKESSLLDATGAPVEVSKSGVEGLAAAWSHGQGNGFKPPAKAATFLKWMGGLGALVSGATAMQKFAEGDVRGGVKGAASAAGSVGEVFKESSFMAKGAARGLVGVGVIANVGFAAWDVHQGKYTDAGLNLVSAGGTLVPLLWEGTSWAGPVGWGLAAVGTVGAAVHEHGEYTEVAEPEIDLGHPPERPGPKAVPLPGPNRASGAS